MSSTFGWLVGALTSVPGNIGACTGSLAACDSLRNDERQPLGPSGVGIGFAHDKAGVLRVDTLRRGAETSGIRMDDILVSVDDMPCMHSPADTASLLLAGPQGSFVSVRVQRGGIQHDFLLRRTFKLADDAPASKHEQWSKCETALSAEDVPTPAVGVDEVRSCLSVSPSQSGLSLGPVRRGILKSDTDSFRSNTGRRAFGGAGSSRAAPYPVAPRSGSKPTKLRPKVPALWTPGDTPRGEDSKGPSDAAIDKAGGPQVSSAEEASDSMSARSQKTILLRVDTELQELEERVKQRSARYCSCVGVECKGQCVTRGLTLAEEMRKRELESLRDHKLVFDPSGRLKGTSGCAIFQVKSSTDTASKASSSDAPALSDSASSCAGSKTATSVSGSGSFRKSSKANLAKMGSSASSLVSKASMTSGTLEEFVMLERDHTIAMQKKRRPMIAASSAANVMAAAMSPKNPSTPKHLVKPPLSARSKAANAASASKNRTPSSSRKIYSSGTGTPSDARRPSTTPRRRAKEGSWAAQPDMRRLIGFRDAP